MNSKTLFINGKTTAPALIADTFFSRLRGMLFRRKLPQAMLIRPTNAVHGIGMTRRLDVAFIDESGKVLKIACLKPFGFRASRAASAALESPAGSFAKWELRVGDTAEIR